jgi:hypothetical protein
MQNRLKHETGFESVTTVIYIYIYLYWANINIVVESLFWTTTSRLVRLAGHETHLDITRNAFTILVEKSLRKEELLNT